MIMMISGAGNVMMNDCGDGVGVVDEDDGDDVVVDDDEYDDDDDDDDVEKW
jgi:hypothetical protein